MSQKIESTKQEMVQSSIAKNMTGYYKNKINRIIAIALALALGVVFTLMIVEHRIGINYFVLAFVMIVSAGFVMYKDDNLSIAKYAFWAIAFLMYASVFFRLSNVMYTALAILFLPALFILSTIFSGKKLPQNIVVNGLIRFWGSIAFVDKIFIAIRSLAFKKGENNKALPMKIIIGIAISIVLLLMIVPLMFSADSVFEKVIIDFINLESVFEFLWKAVLSAVIAILFFGFLYIITVKKDTPHLSKKVMEQVFHVESTLLVILGIVGVVYSAFSVVQFTHLFGGLDRALPEGFSLTEYARSGYFEQVFLTVINLIIIGASIIFTNNSKGKLKKAVNILLLYFIAINFYLMISSAYKMGLYQREYGFTVLRLMVDILLIFEASIFILLVIKIVRRKTPYLTYALYYAVAFWAIASFINIEGLSADLNIKSFEKGGTIDVHYLSRLDDTSKQLKYLYIEHYDDFKAEDIKKIENYFLEDEVTKYRSNGEKIILLDTYIEYNISRANRVKCANEIIDNK